MLVAFALSFLLGVGAIGNRPSREVTAVAASHALDRQASPSAYAHFLAARLAHDRGDATEELKQLRLAEVSDPSSRYLARALAEAYLRAEAPLQAERVLRRFLDRAPRSHDAQLLLGEVLEKRGRLFGARSHLRRAIALRPRAPDAYLAWIDLELKARHPGAALKVARALWRRARSTEGLARVGGALAEASTPPPKRAEKVLKETASDDPRRPSRWAALAEVELKRGEQEAAARHFARAIRLKSRDPKTLFDAGRLALARSDWPTASADFDALSALDPSPETALRVGLTEALSGRPAAASAVLDRALEKGAFTPRIAFYDGVLHQSQAHFRRAEAAFAQVPSDAPLAHDATVHRAHCLVRLGRFSEADALLKSALAEVPGDVELTAAYARSLEAGGKVAQAKSLLQKAIARAPDPGLYMALAELLGRHGAGFEAVVLLSSELKKRPEDVSLLFALGSAYARIGELPRALRTMRRLLQVAPDDAAAMNFIGFALARKGTDLKGAEKLLVRAVKIAPDRGAYWDSLGWTYLREGKTARAVKMLEKAARLNPDEPLILEHLGDAYRKSARVDEARAAYGRALQALRDAGNAEGAEAERGQIEGKLKLLSKGAPDR